jgi:uncharacterized protein (TIGR02391 family)
MADSSEKDICFTDSQLTAIAQALAHTSEGLTGSEIQHLLAAARMRDVDEGGTKWIRLHNAFAVDQNTRKNRTHILAFIRKAMKPERYIRAPDRYEPLRSNVNKALAFAGLVVLESGQLESVEAASTLAEAQRRAQDLRADLALRGVHADVLKFCRAELLADNYFHAVLEATKSVMDKIRSKTGLLDDGSALVDRALAGDPPMLAINSLRNDNERSEQRGFANLVRGMIGMFRNPAAHAPKISWTMSKTDAEDLLSLVSLIHRRLDESHMPVRC